MSSITDLIRHWDGLGRPTPPPVSIRSRAMKRARVLLALGERGARQVLQIQSDLDKECLYAVVSVVSTSYERRLARELLAAVDWPTDEFGELNELRSDLAAHEAFERALRRWCSDESTARLSTRNHFRAAEDWLARPISARTEAICHEALTSFDRLRCICALVLIRMETSPTVAHQEATFLYAYLSSQVPRVDFGNALIGEVALLAGIACRYLFRRVEAREWFDRAESRFRKCDSPAASLAQLRYHRLGLEVYERQFEKVLRDAPSLETALRKHGLIDLGIGCLFLEGCALRELGYVTRSIEVHQRAHTQAAGAGNHRLAAQALANLAQLHRIDRNLDAALGCAQEALPHLQQFADRVDLAKLRWCVGDIFREQGRREDALASYRGALRESEEIGTRLDVVELRLVIADLLLDGGHDREAEQEVRATLPIIEEEQIVPEGLAALGLLRESLRRRQLDRGALRDLHGYFPKG